MKLRHRCATIIPGSIGRRSCPTIWNGWRSTVSVALPRCRKWPEFVILIPERRLLAHRRAEMENRRDRLASDAERHHRRGMVMAHRKHIAAGLIDAAVNDT